MTPLNAKLCAAILAALSLVASGTAPARDLRPIDAMRDATTLAPAASGARATALLSLTTPATLHPRFGVPTFLWGTQAAALLAASPRRTAAKADSASSPEDSARARLADLADLYAITPAEITALPMQNVQRFPNGSAIVRFGHDVAGVEIFREQINVLLDPRGDLVSVGGFVIGAATNSAKSAPVEAVDATHAVAASLGDYGFGAEVAARLQPSGAENGYVFYGMSAATTSADGSSLAAPARVKRVWFRRGSELVPAFYVEVQVRDGQSSGTVDAYAYVISALDGTLLFRRNQTAEAAYSYRVFAEPTPPYLPFPTPAGRAYFPHPTGAPDNVQPPLVAANLITVQNIPFSRNDPWLNGTSNRTVGNNVEVFSNAFSPDDFNLPAVDECTISLPVNSDLHACTNAPNTFDYAYDFNQAPGVSRPQVMAAVTNLFYLNNYMHDWYYDAGFDEVSGNAQQNNYGRGGLANDSIFAELQDFTGTNNANMTTPADGQRPRMRMFVWNPSAALVRVVSPAPIAGVKTSRTAEFGAQVFDFTAEVVPALDAANPTGPTPTDGCTAFTNAPAVAGKIALIDRGICTFVEKAKNAQAAGAIGVLIANNVAGQVGMAGSDATVTIALASVSLADGAAIRSQLATQPVTLRMVRVSGVQRDGAFDTTLVAHEWGHYISNRLVNNTNGLVANQATGMGEGFADFHAMLLLVKEEDRAQPANANFNGTYAGSMYASAGPDIPPDVFSNAFYYGIRRYPYSRDMTKNPLTFRHIADGVTLPAAPPQSPNGPSGANSEVHNTGEVWASMLWECYSNLLNDTGRLTFTQAQDRMKRYLVAGYKLMPSDPTFVTARDAILAAMLAQDPRDHDLCLAGFAKRGAGVGAVAPDQLADDNAGVVESFRTTAAAPNTSVAIEFYNKGLDHYFITWVPDEIAKLDAGTVIKGWARTSQSFSVYTLAQGGTSPVCRYYIPPLLGDSHFFGRGSAECNATGAKNPSFVLEDPTFMHVFLPAGGVCPAGTQPVYRVFSNRPDANHRYMTDKAVRDQMVAKGWLAEGDGPDLVVMCAPL